MVLIIRTKAIREGIIFPFLICINTMPYTPTPSFNSWEYKVFTVTMIYFESYFWQVCKPVPNTCPSVAVLVDKFDSESIWALAVMIDLLLIKN